MLNINMSMISKALAASVCANLEMTSIHDVMSPIVIVEEVSEALRK